VQGDTFSGIECNCDKIKKYHKNSGPGLVLPLQNAIIIKHGGNFMPVILSAQDIYDKEFSVDSRGYSAGEVDAYLDQIIEDYQEYEEQTQKLSSALVSCDQKIKELSEENAGLKASQKQLQEQLESALKELEEAKAALAKTSLNETSAPEEETIETEAAESTTVVTPQFKAEPDSQELTLEERVAKLEKAVFGR